MLQRDVHYVLNVLGRKRIERKSCQMYDILICIVILYVKNTTKSNVENSYYIDL